MATRTELPWKEITQDVMMAVNNETPKLKFINVNRLSDEIMQNPERYQTFAKLPVKTLRFRITHSLRHELGWETYSEGNGRGVVLIRPESEEECFQEYQRKKNGNNIG